MLTVRELLRDLDVQVISGEAGLDNPVRWVHISELPDPTPWLSGGELLLTTGLQLDSAARQRDFIRLLHGHHLAGLGFGTGFDHAAVPDALLKEARAHDFPVFEVPYDLPFIAITEKAFTRLVNEQYEVLQRGIAIQRRLERLILEERGLDEVMRALAATIGGAVIVLSSRGETMAAKAFRRELGEEALGSLRNEVVARAVPPNGNGAGESAAPVAFAPEHPELAGRGLALPVATRGSGAPQAWLVAIRDAGALGDFERLILQQAVTVVALELLRQRVMRDTERRLAGDVLAEALTGRLEPDELQTRLRPFGVRDTAAVLLFELDDAAAAEPLVDRFMASAGVGALVAPREHQLCAVVDTADGDPIELAARAREALVAEHGAVRAAASRPSPTRALRRSYHEARCALEAASIGGEGGPEVASYKDLGAFQLLLSLQDEDALRLYCDNLLGPLENGEGDYGDELMRSLEAFIEQNGQWERAARQLFCHRHTLRYRIRRIEELTGRDLSRARDRIEFWLALRGRELVR